MARSRFSQHDDARLPEVLSMGSLNGAYGGQHSDAPLSMMPQQHQQAPQVPKRSLHNIGYPQPCELADISMEHC